MVLRHLQFSWLKYNPERHLKEKYLNLEILEMKNFATAATIFVIQVLCIQVIFTIVFPSSV